jgi:hypothetical protein
MALPDADEAYHAAPSQDLALPCTPCAEASDTGTFTTFKRPLIAHIPNNGPIVMAASAQRQPYCEAIAAMARMEKAVKRKPRAV